MAPNSIEIISLGVAAFLVLYGALSLCWSFLEGRKSVPSREAE